VAIIVGSTREGRFGGTVANWFAAQAGPRDDMVLDVIDLVDVDLPMVRPLVATPRRRPTSSGSVGRTPSS